MRRHWGIIQAACAMLLGLATACASAQATNYPDRPIRLIIPFAAGGTTDVLARLIAHGLTPALGQTVIAENRSGAATVIGTSIVVSAPPDGYTLLEGSVSLSITPNTMAKLPYDPVRDLTPVIQTSTQAYLVLVRPSFPAQSIEELIRYARANPGKVSFGSPGHGSGGHLAAELFALDARIKMTHIAYKGDNPALSDLAGGHIDLMFATMASALPHLQSGQLVPLAITSPRRSKRYPALPTVAEAGVPGFEAASWNGIFVPAGTPAPIVARLEREIAAILQTPELLNWFAQNGAEPGGLVGDAFGAMLVSNIAKWSRLVRAVGIKPE